MRKRRDTSDTVGSQPDFFAVSARVSLTCFKYRLQKLFRLSQTALPSKVVAVCLLSVGGRQSQ